MKSAIGGLHILGTERHEIRRIDNQLRTVPTPGRIPVVALFLSLEDDSCAFFAGDKVKALMHVWNGERRRDRVEDWFPSASSRLRSQ